MHIVNTKVPVTTDASGDFEVVIGTCEGILMRITYVPDGSTPLDTGADLTITETGTTQVIYTQTNIGTSAFIKLPRHPIASTTDGVDSTTVFDYIPVNDQLQLTIAQGGNAKSGVFWITTGKN